MTSDFYQGAHGTAANGATLATLGTANCWPYPYQPPVESKLYYCYTYPEAPAEFEIRTAKNGYFAKKGGFDFVFESEKSLCDWLLNELKAKKG